MQNKNLIIIIIAVVLVGFGFYYYKATPVNDIDESDAIMNEEVKNDIPEGQVKTTPVAPSGEVLPSMENGKYLIYYFADGFSPNTLQIQKGQSVKFINKSDGSMRVYASNQDFSIYREFNQSVSVGKEGVYEYTFNETGVWPYNNQNNQAHMGNILVY